MSVGDSNQNRKAYIIVCFILLIFVNAFKGLSVGPDTVKYYEYFVETNSLSWSRVWNDYIQQYWFGNGDYDEGYTVYTKFVQLFSKDFIFFLFFHSLIYFIPFGIILNKYCDRLIQLMFAFVFYITLVFNGGSMLSRQQVGTVFLFLSFLFVLKDRYLWSIFFIFIASCMHKSTWVFIAVPIIARFAPRIIKPMHTVSFFMIPIAIVFSAPILLFAASFLGTERYEVYAETEKYGGATFVVLMELLSLICYLGFKKSYLKENDLARKIYIMAPFITVFAPLILRDGVFIRLSKYFHVFIAVMVPLAFDQLSKKSTVNIVYFIVIAILIVYTSLGSGNYCFIWQEPYMHYIG